MKSLSNKEKEVNHIQNSINTLNQIILRETDPKLETINEAEVFRLVNTKLSLQYIKCELLELERF